MKLSENQNIVDALKHILEDYEYLEYDKKESSNMNHLVVKVTDLNAVRSYNAARRIKEELTKATRLEFNPVVLPNPKPGHAPNTSWTHFNIREKTK